MAENRPLKLLKKNCLGSQLSYELSANELTRLHRARPLLGISSNSYSRRRRRLRPIKTGVKSSFFPPKQENLQLSRRQRRPLSLAVCKTELEGLKMNSFKNVRELLLQSYLAMLTTSFLIESLSFFMTLISPKIPTLTIQHMTRSISITSIQLNVKQSFALKKPTFLALLKHCNCVPLSIVNKGLSSIVWKDCVCF